MGGRSVFPDSPGKIGGEQVEQVSRLYCAYVTAASVRNLAPRAQALSAFATGLLN